MPSLKYQEPHPTGWSKKQVQTFAADAAKQLGYAPGGDLEKLVQKLGGQVTVGDIASARETGSITVDGPKQFTISLSPYSGDRRSRFTIAHELGHYILHSKAGAIPLSVARDGSGPVEWEANWFAAGFLMPEQELQDKMAAGWGDAELAQHFHVSQAAVQIRKQSL
ncbi:MAG: hypothetical protein JWL90_2471 [Chthoniobacteraceae bacterium]|nr:hypothetical protein [Chthoniobacteraceae bacterium]